MRLRHLREPRGCFACSTSAAVLLLVLEELLLQGMSQWSKDTMGTVPPFSHEAAPLFSNLIDIKESTKKLILELDSSSIIHKVIEKIKYIILIDWSPAFYELANF